ncbi:hypothetical protein ASD37_25445 [Mycobacterium sp. Root135]|uniref:hypothetical protein n=1 Tax=Mycobacterium sp. Root135 TaxID=1736457 RepID=UPI0006FBE4EA|nr:hypothetical protein [Mycobacterium sp. Root135]KQY02900.1 hypothetical protein ASD37_25445 [Mycobacterium sp. Root135]
MRGIRWIAVATLTLAACSPTSKTAQPPSGFPDVRDFTAVSPDDPKSTLPSFRTADQISCVVDFGDRSSIVCSGDLRGLPQSVGGTGCPSVRKADTSAGDAPYVFERSGPDCASSRAMPLSAGQKVVGKNGTCVIGDDHLVACIDADNRHGFVLRPSGSWVF